MRTISFVVRAAEMNNMMCQMYMCGCCSHMLYLLRRRMCCFQ